MGLFFRKSVSLGPLRLNFSKSGVGASVGMKGARLSFTPRGTYVNMGAHGIYYRKRIDSVEPREQRGKPEYFEDTTERKAEALKGVIRTADSGQLVDSTSEEMLSEINRNAALRAKAPFVWSIGILAIIALIALLQSQFGERAAGFSVAAGVLGVLTTVVVAMPTAKRDSIRRTTPLFYELDDFAQGRFSRLTESCRSLGQTRRLWRVQSTQPNWDWKHHAGASSLITRQPARVCQMRPTHIATNVEIWGLDCGTIKLFFFPDWLFVFQGGVYGAVSYDTLSVECSNTQFIEDGTVPSDSAVKGYTWQYVRRDGGPDLRFTNNRQLPIAIYALLRMTSPHGLNLHFHASSVSSASAFTETIAAARSVRFKDAVPPKQPRQSINPQTEYSARAVALAMLGLNDPTTPSEIKSAYRQMVQMYHPDKVATLATEFRELAHRRMKEINNAYSILNEPDGPPPEARPPQSSETFIVRCPHCEAKLAVPTGCAGKVRKCPRCKRPIKAPVHSS
jgi:hypothetical protein